MKLAQNASCSAMHFSNKSMNQRYIFQGSKQRNLAPMIRANSLAVSTFADSATRDVVTARHSLASRALEDTNKVGGYRGVSVFLARSRVCQTNTIPFHASDPKRGIRRKILRFNPRATTACQLYFSFVETRNRRRGGGQTPRNDTST